MFSCNLLTTLIKKVICIYPKLIFYQFQLKGRQTQFNLFNKKILFLNEQDTSRAIREALLQGFTEEENGNFASAKRIYNKILEIKPNEHNAIRGLAGISLKEKDYKNAKLLINKLISLGFHDKANYDLLRHLKRFEGEN